MEGVHILFSAECTQFEVYATEEDYVFASIAIDFADRGMSIKHTHTFTEAIKLIACMNASECDYSREITI